jgi:predicted TIM-barrel fold metal-dependent hydrolase
VLSLLFSGTLARCPDIRFIFSHSGGTIPFLSGRILHSGSNRAFLGRVPKGIDHELRKLHYDVALACFKPALAALFAYIPESQVLLGSDYPFSSVALSIKGLEEHGLSKDTLDALYSGNIERLIPRLKG